MQKKIIALTLVLFTGIFLVSTTWANCPGKEWSLGRAIQVTPTNSTDSKWPPWKAQLGMCGNNGVVFSTSKYFNTKPDATILSTAFNATVHKEMWHEVPIKNRTYYVFESEWQVWHKQAIGSQAALGILLLSHPPRQPGPGNLAYTPDNPSPTSENEAVLTLTANAWQRTYAIGEMYAQIEVRADGAKMKFGQRIDANHIKFFDVRYKIPVSADWYPGITPFILSDMFPGYIFKDEFYPEDEKDVWAVRVFVPGYKHTTWTPGHPNPKAGSEGIITLNQYSWQNMYPVGTTYCQVSLQNDDIFKIKFGRIYDGYVKIFNLYRDIPMPSGWTRGDAPMNLPFNYPEYQFGTGSDPGATNDVWTAQVWIPGYNL